MGAEGSIEVFQENELENDLGFLKDESLREIFNRYFEDMLNVLIHPHRMEYNFEWLKAHYNGCDDYEVNEFKFSCVDGTKLNCVKWIRDPNADLCVIYLHTNSRSLCDATELLPLCNLLNANLLSFDQRGAGRSEGHLSFRVVEDLTAIIESLGTGNSNVKVILWARGLSSSVGVEYIIQQQDILANWIRMTPSRRLLAQERKLRQEKERENAGDCKEGTFVEEETCPPHYVKFLVLDTPITCLEDVVLEATKHIEVLGGAIPSVFVKFALYMFKNKIQESLHIDPYSISPLDWIKKSPRIAVGQDGTLPPCYVLAADDDEFIPTKMGQVIAAEWKKKAGESSCWFREFPGTHFDERDECLVMTPLQSILDYVNIYNMQNEDEKIDEGELDVQSNNATSESGHPRRDTSCKRLTSQNTSNTSKNDSMWDSIPKWQDSEDITNCNFCSTPFSLLNRKHHCRRCGLVVCSGCSSSRVPLPGKDRVSTPGKKLDDNTVEAVRVCDTCVNILNLTFS